MTAPEFLPGLLEGTVHRLENGRRTGVMWGPSVEGNWYASRAAISDRTTLKFAAHRDADLFLKADVYPSATHGPAGAGKRLPAHRPAHITGPGEYVQVTSTGDIIRIDGGNRIGVMWTHGTGSWYVSLALLDTPTGLKFAERAHAEAFLTATVETGKAFTGHMHYSYRIGQYEHFLWYHDQAEAHRSAGGEEHELIAEPCRNCVGEQPAVQPDTTRPPTAA